MFKQTESAAQCRVLRANVQKKFAQPAFEHRTLNPPKNHHNALNRPKHVPFSAGPLLAEFPHSRSKKGKQGDG